MSITAEHKSTANEQKSITNEQKSATNEQKSTSWQKNATNEQKNAAKGQKSATPPIAKLLHNVVIILNKNGYAEREREMPELHCGELVQYITTERGAKASMAFPDLSPYRTDDRKDTEIPGSQIMELVRPLRNGQASFLGRCYLTLANGKKVGWDPDNYELGGGDHRVQKP